MLPVSFSIALRIKTMYDACLRQPPLLDAWAKHVQQLRCKGSAGECPPVLTVLGLGNHPTVIQHIKDRRRLTLKTVVQIVYRCDLPTQFLTQAGADKAMQAAQPAKKEHRDNLKGLHKAARIAAVDQQARIVLRHVVREHFRHMCTEGQFYISDSPSAPLQSLCAALVPGSAASLQAQHLSASGEPQQIDMILEKEGGLCWSDCFSDGAGRYVMRVVKKNPNQQHRVCVSEHFVRGLDNFDVAVSVHRVISGSFEPDGCMVVSPVPESLDCDGVVLWDAPDITSFAQAKACLHVWTSSITSVEFASASWYAGQSDSAAVLLQDMYRSGALASSDRRFEIVHSSSAGPGSPSFVQLLHSLRDAGMVEAAYEYADRSAWALTPACLASMVLRETLRQPMPVFVPRDGQPSVEWTSFELMALLHSRGWDMICVNTPREKASVKALSITEPHTRWYIYKGHVQHAYLCVLAVFETSPALLQLGDASEIAHFRQEKVYNKMLGLKLKQTRSKRATNALQGDLDFNVAEDEQEQALASEEEHIEQPLDRAIADSGAPADGGGDFSDSERAEADRLASTPNNRHSEDKDENGSAADGTHEDGSAPLAAPSESPSGSTARRLASESGSAPSAAASSHSSDSSSDSSSESSSSPSSVADDAEGDHVQVPRTRETREESFLWKGFRFTFRVAKGKAAAGFQIPADSTGCPC